MRSAITIFTLLFILQLQCMGQTITEYLHKRDSIEKLNPVFDHSLITLGGGISFPRGIYATAGSFDEDAGFAQPGPFGEFSYTYLFMRTMGVGVSGFAALHTVNDSALLALYQEYLPNEVSDVYATSYIYRSLMGHLFLTLGSGFFHVDAKLMAGYGFLHVSDILVFENADHETFEQDGGESKIMNLGGELALRFRIAEHFSLQLSESYLRGEFNALSAYAYTYGVVWTHIYDRPLRIANTSLSLTYSF